MKNNTDAVDVAAVPCDYGDDYAMAVRREME